MENAAKALIFAGEILIGVLLLTLMMAIFTGIANFSETVNSNIEMKVLYEFNEQFEIYDKRQDLVAQDVITILNLAKDYNHKVQEENLFIKVFYENNRIDTYSENKTYEFIKNNTDPNTPILFTCNITKYDTNTKKVKEIRITKNK